MYSSSQPTSLVSLSTEQFHVRRQLVNLPCLFAEDCQCLVQLIHDLFGVETGDAQKNDAIKENTGECMQSSTTIPTNRLASMGQTTATKRRPPGLVVSAPVPRQIRDIEDGKNVKQATGVETLLLPRHPFLGLLFVKVFLLSFRLQPLLLRLHLGKKRHAEFQVGASNTKKTKRSRDRPQDASSSAARVIRIFCGFSAESYRNVFSHLAVDQGTTAELGQTI